MLNKVLKRDSKFHFILTFILKVVKQILLYSNLHLSLLKSHNEQSFIFWKGQQKMRQTQEIGAEQGVSSDRSRLQGDLQILHHLDLRSLDRREVGLAFAGELRQSLRGSSWRLRGLRRL